MLVRPAPTSFVSEAIFVDRGVTRNRAVAATLDEKRSGSPRLSASRRLLPSPRREPCGGFGLAPGCGVGSGPVGVPFGSPPSGGGTVGPSAKGGAWVTV